MNFYSLLNKYKKSLFSIIIIIIALVGLNRALLKDVVYESDDYFLHATRIGNYYLALKQGQLPVRWGPNLNQSYGYPSFNYMYHTPYLVAVAIHVIGFSVQESLNLSVLFAIIFGSISCYFFVRSYLKSEFWSVLLSLFFIINPYTFLNIYWRGAVGEIYFYSLVPIFLLGIKKRNLLLIAVSISFLILSHLPSMILLAPVTAIFIITEFKKINIKSLSTVIYGTIIGILLSSWYWIPAIFEQWMIQYQSSGSLTQYADQFTSILSIFDLRKNFNSDDSYLKVINIGTISLLTIFIGLYLTKVNKKIIFWLILIFLSIFFLTNYSLFIWNLLKPLQYVQYPWRFLWVITIASLLIMIYFISEKKIKELWKKIICFLFILGLFFTMRAFIATKGFTTRSDFDWYHPANDTGSSFNEHNPIWARGPYYFPDELMYVNASQSANLNSQNVGQLTHKLSNLSPAILQFDGRTISYEVSPDQSIVVLHKRLFYPGWEASLDSEKTEFAQDIPEYNGVLAVSVPAKKSTVNITFTGYTKTRRFAEILSLATFVWLCMYYLLKKLWQNS